MAAFFGGLWLNRKGPRVVALTGGFLYGAGVFLASFSDHKLWWLYLTYGVIGGIGVGFSYIVPVAVLVKWFPDRRGLITGIAVGGFGAGALITAPVATRLIQSVGVLSTFAYLGIAYLVVTVVSGYFMQNPPEGWRPEGWSPRASQASQRSSRDYTLADALKTGNGGPSGCFSSSTRLQEFQSSRRNRPCSRSLRSRAVAAASMVGVASIGNAVGRVFWAWASDSITRRATFGLMFLSQVSLFWALPSIHSAARTYDRRLHCAHVLRRGLWHHARLYSRLFWTDKRGSHLRVDVDGVGLRQRLWTAAYRIYATDQRQLSWRSPCHRGHHVDLCGSSSGRLAAPAN